MADWKLGVNTEVVLKTVVSLSGEQLNLARGLLERQQHIEKQLQILAKKLEENQAMLSDAQTKQATNKAVQLWVKNLQSAALDAQIVLDEFGYEVLRQKVKTRTTDKVRTLISYYSPFSSRSHLAQQIKDVLSSLDGLLTESNRLGLRPIQRANSVDPESSVTKVSIRTALPAGDAVDVDPEFSVVGRDDDLSKLIDLLTVPEAPSPLPVIAILGNGGLGKTTVARLIYNHEKLKSHFDTRLWVCCTYHHSPDKSVVESLLSDMLQSITKDTELNLGASKDDLVKDLGKHLKGKSYLLVLDNVSKEKGDEWAQLRTTLLEIGGSEESRILATTRSGDVALAMGMSGYHRLPPLSQDQSWELFEKCAFAPGEPTRTPQLEEVGKRILKRCGGVPLAIKAVGRLLYSKNSELDWLMIDSSGTWNAFDGEDSHVLAAIKLAYDHFPSVSLKQCFSYCAIFEKDTTLEKDELVQLWMAQGLLNPSEGSRLQMEEVGSEYFSAFIMSSLLEYPGQDLVGSTTKCQMHDLVHDISLKVSQDFCFHTKDLESGDSKVEAMHVSITLTDHKMWKRLKSVFLSKLRTLHLKGVDLTEEILEKFRHLYVLIVDHSKTKELPDIFGDMKYLRFLDISKTSITSLPKSFKKLYSLQTLRVYSLSEAPKGFGDLLSLRHFHMKEDGQRTVFPELGQLRNLQTLPYFNVSQREGCRIEELAHLDNLRGRLAIFGLQNVESYENAAKAKLSNKLQINALELHWDNNRKKDQVSDDTEVMEGLQPHPDLKSLVLDGYQSTAFPSWMVSKNGTLLLRRIVKLSLQKLDKCEQLPSLGDLPFLEHLHIRSLRKVKRIGAEFYGASSEAVTVFPALRTLELIEMVGLKEWSDANGNGSVPSQVNDAFPHLKEMNIFDLPNLKAFPNLGKLPSLEQLNVKRCKAHPMNVEG